MGSETCATNCPAILYVAGQSAAIDVRLANLAARETAREQKAQAWSERMGEAVAAGEPIDELRARRDISERLSDIASGSDSDIETRLGNGQSFLEWLAERRQSHCAKGPKNGILGSGIGSVVCRSTIDDDGLPNKGQRPSR